MYISMGRVLAWHVRQEGHQTGYGHQLTAAARRRSVRGHLGPPVPLCPLHSILCRIGIIRHPLPTSIMMTASATVMRVTPPMKAPAPTSANTPGSIHVQGPSGASGGAEVSGREGQPSYRRIADCQ